MRGFRTADCFLDRTAKCISRKMLSFPRTSAFYPEEVLGPVESTIRAIAFTSGVSIPGAPIFFSLIAPSATFLILQTASYLHLQREAATSQLHECNAASSIGASDFYADLVKDLTILTSKGGIHA